MEYSWLGNSELKVSRIGFGCMSLKTGDPATGKLLHKALHSGINFFDTADLYDKGMNEELVGKTFSKNRKDVIIATKVGNRWKEDGSGWYWGPGKKYILSAVEASLSRLQTDYIDLYQLHGGTLEDPVGEIIEAFELLVSQGKIRYYGISSIRPVVIREWVSRSAIISVMLQYSLLDRRPKETVLSFLKDHHRGVLVRGALAQGLLAGKAAKEYLTHGSEEVKKAADAVLKLSGETRSRVHVALQYVLSNHSVTSAVVGIRTEEQLNEALGALQTPYLTREETNN